MPIYEYRCGDCGYQKEYMQRMADAPLTDCPKCGKRSFNKLVSAAGFQLKGTGWYATDFKNNGKKPAAKQDKADAKPDKPAEGSGKESSSKEFSSKESSSKESSSSDTSCGSGACPACS